MKRFLILMTAVLLSNFVKADVSCWYYPTYNYYLFKILDTQTEDEDFLEYWKNYAGGKTPVYSYDFSYGIDAILSDIENGSSSKAVIDAAIQKKDTEMLDYLKDLSTYLNVNQDFYNQWEYPDENQIKEYREVYEKLLEKAKKYSGQRLKDRYNLMAMRCMFQLEKYPEVEKFWLSDGIKTQDEYCKKQMTGLFAGALYHQKKINAAVNIFLQIKDIQSVKFCLDDKRNLDGIRERYDKDKNDGALVFLVQDFVNMFQENIDSEDYGRPFDFRNIDYADAQDFITFANQIADKKASKTPVMWKTAAAMLSYYLNDIANAKKYAEQTASLEGTQRMKDVARVVRFFLSTKGEKYSSSKAAYYLSECLWLDKMAETDGFFENAKSRIVYQNLLPQNPNTNFYTLLASTDYTTINILKLNAAELESYLNYITQTKKLDNFEKYLLTKSHVKRDDVIEKLGTRYLGEMNFIKAEDYLSQVPVSYYKESPLRPYMVFRDYTQQRWNVTQDWIDDWGYDDESELEENQKIKFCKEIKTLTEVFERSTGDKRYSAAMKLATYLTQASRWGNCWYLLEYSWGVYEPRSKAQQTYEEKALAYFDEAVKSSDDKTKYEALYGKTWLLWHDYNYYAYDYMVNHENQTVTPQMEKSMSDLKNYWDGVYGVGGWTISCDCVMDYVRTH